jgi:hypothetical protein
VRQRPGGGRSSSGACKMNTVQRKSFQRTIFLP